MIQKLILNALWVVVRTLMATYRFEHAPGNKLQREKFKGTFIFAIWHEEMIGFLSAHAWTHPYLTLASKSKDGDYAAFVSSKMGFTPVRGSSKKKNVDKGGKEAIEEYIQYLTTGTSGGITVDGPKGPRHTCKIGIAKIAQQTGCPIVPGVAIASNAWELNSWDKFKIPKPFSKISVVYGDPIWVKSDATPDELLMICSQIEKAITALAN